MARSDLTDEALREMLHRQRSATHGPWRSFVEGRDHDSGDSFISAGGRDLYLTFHDELGTAAVGAEDLDFIAHSRRDIGLLLDEVRRLRAVLYGETLSKESKAELAARPCVMCGSRAFGGVRCERCGRNQIDPDYLDAIELLARQVVGDAFNEQPNLRQDCKDGSDLDRSIMQLCDGLGSYHWDGDGCIDH